MTREEILEGYTVSNGRITSPGKFQGEPVFALKLWDIGMDGMADGEDADGAWRFKVPKDDPLRAEWPELDAWLGRRRIVRLRQSDSGFVHCF